MDRMRKYFYIIAFSISALLCACQTTQSPKDNAISATKKVLTTSGKVLNSSGKVLSSSGKAIKQTGAKTGEILKAAGEKSVDIAKTVSQSQAVKRITLSPAANDVEETNKKHSLGEAALSPLNDTNIRRPAIPERLLALDLSLIHI